MRSSSLEGKRGLVVGIANDRSIAYGCAKAIVASGGQLAVTYLNEKAEPYVRPLAEGMGCPIIAPCDVTKEGELENVFAEMQAKWGGMDFLIHSIAYAQKEDLQGRVVDCSTEGFARAMLVSCHSFLRMARLSEPLMKDGGSLLALTYYGSEKAIHGYGMMGPIKAALESCVRYASVELGKQNIRVNALSAGPISTRAASGVPGFDDLKDRLVAVAPLQRATTIEDVGSMAAFLVSDAAGGVSGGVHYVDCGIHAIA